MKTIITVAALATLVSPQFNTADTIRDRLDKYLIEYEPQLSSLVAEELMTQRMKAQQWVVTNRRIESEVAFVALPANAGWLGFRRVIRVNGKDLKDRGVPLAQLLLEGASDDFDQARLLLADSAAHNLGAPRTINLPNLPLELLHPRHRHRFMQQVYEQREKIRGTETVLLRFDEISTPTIIQQPRTGNMKTVVWAWIEPTSGRLLRAQVTARDARLGGSPFVAEIRVDFREDPKVGMLVPVEMNEKFFVDHGTGEGTAKYTNYRRFQTSARMVPQ
jgi:hypothetical protein